MATAISVSTIAAEAFRMMELAPISSFADDSPKASAAAEQYPHALAMCLQTYDWSFARKLANLPVSALPENWIADPELPYFYALPGDCIQLRHIVDDEIDWRRDGDYIYASAEGGLTIRYTRLIDNEKLLPSMFQTYVAAQIASLLAPFYVRAVGKVDRIHNQVATLKQMAIDNDTLSGSSHRVDGRTAPADWVSEATR